MTVSLLLKTSQKLTRKIMGYDFYKCNKKMLMKSLQLSSKCSTKRKRWLSFGIIDFFTLQKLFLKTFKFVRLS